MDKPFVIRLEFYGITAYRMSSGGTTYQGYRQPTPGERDFFERLLDEAQFQFILNQQPDPSPAPDDTPGFLGVTPRGLPLKQEHRHYLRWYFHPSRKGKAPQFPVRYVPVWLYGERDQDTH